MGATTEAISANPGLIEPGANRAWEVWDEPPELVPDTVLAFKLVFLTSELAVSPEQRDPSIWQKMVFIEAGWGGKATVISLFVTKGDLVLRHGIERCFRLASLDLKNGRRAQLVAHGEDETNWQMLREQAAAEAQRQVRVSNKAVPPSAYAYFFGHSKDGARFLMGGRVSGKPDESA